MTTGERLNRLEEAMAQSIEDRRLILELTKRVIERIQQNERQIQQTQKIWTAFARHHGWPEDLDEYDS